MGSAFLVRAATVIKVAIHESPWFYQALAGLGILLLVARIPGHPAIAVRFFHFGLLSIRSW